MAGSLNHRNVVGFYDIAEYDGPTVPSSWIPFHQVAARLLTDEGRFRRTGPLVSVSGILGALSAAHAKAPATGTSRRRTSVGPDGRVVTHRTSASPARGQPELTAGTGRCSGHRPTSRRARPAAAAGRRCPRPTVGDRCLALRRGRGIAAVRANGALATLHRRRSLRERTRPGTRGRMSR